MLYSYLKITANSLERVNLSPLLLGNTAARIKVKSPTGRRKKTDAGKFTSTTNTEGDMSNHISNF